MKTIKINKCLNDISYNMVVCACFVSIKRVNKHTRPQCTTSLHDLPFDLSKIVVRSTDSVAGCVYCVLVDHTRFATVMTVI